MPLIFTLHIVLWGFKGVLEQDAHNSPIHANVWKAISMLNYFWVSHILRTFCTPLVLERIGNVAYELLCSEMKNGDHHCVVLFLRWYKRHITRPAVAWLVVVVWEKWNTGLWICETLLYLLLKITENHLEFIISWNCSWIYSFELNLLFWVEFAL